MYQLTLKQKHTKFGINQSAVKTYENIALQLVYFMMFYIDSIINQDTYIKRFRDISKYNWWGVCNKIVSYLPDY